MNAAPALTGQSAGLIDAVKPVAQIIEETISEFNEACQKNVCTEILSNEKS